MVSRPRIGAIIRDGIKRKSLRQGQVAEKLGVSRSAVNAWANDRAYPQPYVIVPLEELLGVKIPDMPDGPAPPAPEPPADPRERAVYDLALQDMDESGAWEFVEEFRRLRAKHRATA